LIKYFEDKISTLKEENKQQSSELIETKKKMELMETNSELQLLQDENIELHQENKELIVKNHQLKNEVLTLKRKTVGSSNDENSSSASVVFTSTPLMSSSLVRNSTPKVDTSSSVVSSSVPIAPRVTGAKRAFGQELDISSVSSSSAVYSNKNNTSSIDLDITGKVSVQKDASFVKTTSTVPVEGIENTVEDKKEGNNVNQRSKRQRVKAATASTVTEGENPGECTQS
jgi:hypothetical protein